MNGLTQSFCIFFTASDILPFIPKLLELDIFNEKAWVSAVAFTIKLLRPRLLPPFPIISTFNEVNIRTYVTAESKPGIYFIDIRADKLLSLRLARLITGLNYQHGNIERKRNWYSLNAEKYLLSISSSPQSRVQSKINLDKWLTERYCVYLYKKNNLYRYQIHHSKWKLNYLNLSELQLHL